MGDLLTQCLAGSLASADHWSRCVCGYGVILVGRWGCKAFLQEGLPLVQMWSLQNRSDIRRSLEPLCLRLWGRPRRTVGVQSLCSRGPALGPCSRCLPGTCVVLSSMAYRSRFQRFLSWILKENIGLNDRSHTLLLLVVRLIHRTSQPEAWSWAALGGRGIVTAWVSSGSWRWGVELTAGARLTERRGRGDQLGRREPKGKTYFP
jgi:hypothetical protein